MQAHRVLGAAGQPEVEVEVTTRQGTFRARAGVPFLRPEAAPGEAGSEGGEGEEGEGADAARTESEEAGGGEGDAPEGGLPRRTPQKGLLMRGVKLSQGRIGWYRRHLSSPSRKRWTSLCSSLGRSLPPLSLGATRADRLQLTRR